MNEVEQVGVWVVQLGIRWCESVRVCGEVQGCVWVVEVVV